VISTALADAGFEDMPRNGPYVLGGMVNRGGSAAQLVTELGVSKQAASQLTDTLVLRGYLTRSPNPDDRRRIDIAATERGRAAAKVVRSAVQTVEDELAELVKPATIKAMRSGLFALVDIKERMELADRAGAAR
jgi:DNA-binding MarR family transcriptional regulator